MPPPIKQEIQTLTTRKNQSSTTRKETNFGMERVHALAYASFINLNHKDYEDNES